LSFAGIGDPAYNLADPRLVGTSGQQKFPPDTQSSLARLVGSGTEVRQASLAFPQSTVLTGTEASPEGLQKILDSRPAVIHFAVHVVSPPERPEDAALAMTIGRNRVPELVTPELITTYRVPGSLIVMSGCDSQQGKAVPGVGVRGLSRAWLLSGASSVVTSTWPMPDDNGRFFRTFYQRFEADYDGSVIIPQLAAQALAETQNQMRGASGFRHDASFWAAYTVISKE
jgi:CHAT domain-containing protein